ncbi:MAG: insulinase family protein [Acidobacteria bacterium]|nr:insulinase family protein [Acidobacteriota bacterium]MBI3426810.1 insulinase family protein [Acidobacteriota bacterium]
MRPGKCASLLLALLALLASDVFAQQFQIKTHTLKNGMKIIVEEDRSIPNVALYVFYRIGSRNERPGTTGLSHFFEHMMFNGAKKYGPKQFDQTMEAAGGSNNAYTNRDLTVYQDWFPKSALELIFDLEADRIRDLSFDPKIIESERGVVASERRSSVDANNFGILFEQLYADAYTAHPYQWPVVGWMVDIENWKLEDLKRHFEMGYAPSNATMVVSGDITAEEIFKLAEKYIEPIPSHAAPAPVTTREPEQLGERRAVVKKFAQLPILLLGYHVPEARHADYYALQMLQTILFSGQSSRMYQRLVDKDQLALFVNGGFGATFDPTLFTVNAQPKANVAPAQVEAAIYEEFDKVKNAGVTDNELQKARNILLAGFYRQMKTISGKANTIGTYEVFFGDYQKLFSAADDYAKVTKEDVQRVAKQYFNEKNRTVVTLVPEKQ